MRNLAKNFLGCRIRCHFDLQLNAAQIGQLVQQSFRFPFVLASSLILPSIFVLITPSLSIFGHFALPFVNSDPFVIVAQISI